MHVREHDNVVADAVARLRVYDGDGAFRPDANTPIFVSPNYHNLIVTSGKTLVLNRLFGLGSAVALSSVGVGTDSTAAAVAQTQLNPSVSGTVFIQAADTGGITLSGTTVTVVSTFGTGVANFTWNEAGLFNGTTNGTSVMFDRLIIGPFAKTSAVSIQLQIAISQA